MNIDTQKPVLKQQASLGLYFLKEVISEVLFIAQNEKPLDITEIKSRIGIPETDELHSGSNALIFYILSLLEIEARVEEIAEKGSKWKITEVGVSQHKRLML